MTHLVKGLIKKMLHIMVVDKKGTLTEGGGTVTVDHLIKVPCFVNK
jgi:hypothetical protein